MNQIALDWTPAARELSKAVRKRENASQRILTRLEAGPASTLELARIGGVRFSARILELRRAGHKIRTENRPDHAIYVLEGE